MGLPSVSGMLSYWPAGRSGSGSGVASSCSRSITRSTSPRRSPNSTSSPAGGSTFGVGRGYQSIEFGGFKIDLSEARDRFNEALDIIIGLWTHGRFPYDGTYYPSAT